MPPQGPRKRRRHTRFRPMSARKASSESERGRQADRQAGTDGRTDGRKDGRTQRERERGRESERERERELAGRGLIVLRKILAKRLHLGKAKRLWLYGWDGCNSCEVATCLQTTGCWHRLCLELVAWLFPPQQLRVELHCTSDAHSTKEAREYRNLLLSRAEIVHTVGISTRKYETVTKGRSDASKCTVGLLPDVSEGQAHIFDLTVGHFDVVAACWHPPMALYAKKHSICG